ncbi:unnamed protein product [Haemonchus placei]|uniref:Uncharacterized protein n=1 Tax=Haemonchus placei TaxID=6290 RepID=A0A0N4VXK8_HAEPC|nr:unnamed protein product [Haemonchus placei]
MSAPEASIGEGNKKIKWKQAKQNQIAAWLGTELLDNLIQLPPSGIGLLELLPFCAMSAPEASIVVTQTLILLERATVIYRPNLTNCGPLARLVYDFEISRNCKFS